MIARLVQDPVLALRRHRPRRGAALVTGLTLVLAACGGSGQSATSSTTPAAPATESPAPAVPAGEHAHAEGQPGSPVARFHDALAPLWHAPAGAQRVSDTCNAVASLHGIANDIIAAGPPAGASADYADSAKALEVAVGHLHVECGTTERAGFEARFATVHDAFHAVADKAGQ